MELLDLEIFSLVAKEQSVTRAAQLLQRVQSNVTTRVKQLEEELGVQLFSREGKRMTLTGDGQRLLGYAHRMLTLAEEARQAMQSNVPVGRLRIGSMESTAAARLPGLLGAYQSLWPAVQLDISTGTTRALIDDVKASRLDCAFIAETDERAAIEFNTGADADLAAIPAFREELLLLVPSRLGSASESVTHYPLAAFAKGCTYRRIGEQWLESKCAAQGSRPESVGEIVEYHSYHAIFAAVSAGTAVAVFPKSVLATLAVASTVQSIPLAEITTWMVSRPAYQSLALNELSRLLPAR
ncbi:LysR substrate-binding domain-containing protein [Paraburkholderia sp.]|uniref:LysR substrate-binding domain-containing protein n=1 Tax=Paraburkholderia sp. TaxID=1926495 RepID=UPI00286F9A2C|nr:LysR substrate-binding domain-containing protein [Paraburkholderia sp.]